MRQLLASVICAAVVAAPATAWSWQSMDPYGPAAHREALAELNFLDGEWVGEAIVTGQGGQTTVLAHTERVGPMLGGSVKLVEGRGYDADGAVAFNAMAVLSWDDAAGGYRMHSWTQGRSGAFDLTRTDDGFEWELPAGPNAVVRYVAVVDDDTWRQTGHYVAAGMEPVRIFEMNLRRVGDSDWPAGGAVDPTR